MERREALKRLAAGGATAVGATVVVSQPAFAYANPVVSGSPTVSVTTTGSRTAQIAITAPTAVCPASALSRPSPVRVSLNWTTFYPAASTQMSAGTGTNVSIPSSFTQWYPDDRIRITMVYRYQCVYAGRTTEICVRWFREFRASTFGAAAVWTVIGASSTGPTVVSCVTGLSAQTLSVSNSPGRRLD